MLVLSAIVAFAGVTSWCLRSCFTFVCFDLFVLCLLVLVLLLYWWFTLFVCLYLILVLVELVFDGLVVTLVCCFVYVELCCGSLLLGCWVACGFVCLFWLLFTFTC